jgi:hypothetical protein
MQERLLHFLLILIFPLFLNAQGYENTMIFGYAGGMQSPGDDKFCLNILSFSKGNLEITSNQNSEMNFNDTDAAVSDENGNLLFYFNGIDIYNASHVLMENGGLLNEFNEFGYDLPQGGIIIPNPGHPKQYILFHETIGYIEPPTWGDEVIGLYYSIIDMSLNNGLGKVVERKLPLIIDTLEYGRLDLVRHANGRDWWLGVWESHSNTYYQVLVDTKGLHILGKDTTGIARKEGIGQSYFSRDGTKYVVFSSIVYGEEYHYIDIYNFDRCTGKYSNHEQIHLISSLLGGGAMISPNSRWLYISQNSYLYQYDLNASPVAASRTLVDSYIPYNDPFPTKFHRGFLAPDDQIYITTTSGSRTLHVIHDPDEAGIACNFEQNGIRLLCNNGSSLPTFANYRLGPVDGSNCDTLGIDNDPVSWWRYAQDTLEPETVRFHDLSYHNPTEWFWDFGDGTSSTARHPTHTYASAGAYTACLTVSNANGSHTHCKPLNITVSVGQPTWVSGVQVGPNPFSTHLSVILNSLMPESKFRLFDLSGRLYTETSVVWGVNDIETGPLPTGLYFWELQTRGERVKSGKLVKQGE